MQTLLHASSPRAEAPSSSSSSGVPFLVLIPESSLVTHYRQSESAHSPLVRHGSSPLGLEMTSVGPEVGVQWVRDLFGGWL